MNREAPLGPWSTQRKFPLERTHRIPSIMVLVLYAYTLSLASEELRLGQGMFRKKESRSQKVGITGLCNVNID